MRSAKRIRDRMSAPDTATSKTRSDLGESGSMRSKNATLPAKIATVRAGESASIKVSAQTQLPCLTMWPRTTARTDFFSISRTITDKKKIVGAMSHGEKKLLFLIPSATCCSIQIPRRFNSAHCLRTEFKPQCDAKRLPEKSSSRKKLQYVTARWVRRSCRES